MLGKFFECEADRNNKYYRVIQTVKEYSDGRRFPIDEIVISDQKIDLDATDRTQMGGFCISTYEYIFRWLIRGDTLCEVKIPEDSTIYKTVSEDGIYVSEKIILTNPQKIDDNFAMKLYLNSNLPEISYFKAMTACAVCGYINTALKVCEDKVTKENVDIAISEFEDFCTKKGTCVFDKNKLGPNCKKIYKILLKIKNDSNYNFEKKRKLGPFTWIYEIRGKKIIRKYKRNGLHGYPRTVPEKCISNLLNSTLILHPKVYKNTLRYIDEEFIESTKDIKSFNKEDLIDTVIFNIFEMNKLNCNKLKKFTQWKNNSEFLRFQVENLKKVLMNRKCTLLEENIELLNDFIINLDDNRKLSLIHGDIHINNMISNDNGIYLIDWEMATYGDIAYELAMHFILMKYNETDKQIFLDKLCSKISFNKQNLIHDIKVYENFEKFRKNILDTIPRKK